MSESPVRVLHVLGSLECGGVETWLMQLLEHVNRERVSVDVAVNRRGGMYGQRVRDGGTTVLCCGEPPRLADYVVHMSQLLRENGPYQIVHSHLQLLSGAVLQAAHELGVPGRIAHARSSRDGRRGRSPAPLYRVRMQAALDRHATHLLAVSTPAAERIFGKHVMAGGRCLILTGIDLAPFRTLPDRREVRRELSIPAEARIIGHVGNFRRAKNYPFLLQVARQLVTARPDTLVLLVGDGPLRAEVEEQAARLGLTQNIRILGERSDVPRLLRAMDAFVFPSLYEGLPRALLEAQAAGLPCIASDSITPEAAARPGNVLFLPLRVGARTWARAILTAVQKPVSSALGMEAVRELEQRGLCIEANAARLTDLYEQIASAAAPTGADQPHGSLRGGALV